MIALDYLICNIDAAADPKYYGYMKTDGRWYIMQETTATGIYLYVRGGNNYATAWGNRAGLSYVAIDQVTDL
jgi:hypothetical protein